MYLFLGLRSALYSKSPFMLGGGKKREPLLHQKKLGVLRESGEYKGETIDMKIFDIKYANVKTKVFIWAFQRVSGMWTLGV